MASPAPPSAVSELGDRKAPWFMASSATHHMTGDRTFLFSTTPVSSDQVIAAGDGKGMRVCATGPAITETVVLPDVWYVPGLTDNLVSVHQLSTADLTIKFAGRGCIVEKGNDGSVVGIAHLRFDRKYEVDFLIIE